MAGTPLMGLLSLTVVFATLVDYGGAYQTYYMERVCGNGSVVLPLSGSMGPESAVLVHATQSPSYSLALSCHVTVSAPKGHRVTLSVRLVDFRARWDGACEDYVTIRRINYCHKLYREDEDQHYDSDDDSIEFFYRTSGNNVTLSGFQGLQFTLTAFATGAPSSNESFSCANGHVVWSGLKCDGHNNCGDSSDEDRYGDAQCGGGGGDRGPDILIVLGLLIVFLLLVMCAATLFCTKNERVRRFSTRVRTGTLSFLRGAHRNSATV
ncbi:hypothetical protein JTE90_014854 [Oedothorax gibbosus]|uniref:CUB domain-containing protein n=1 Tax=Oedothorax gibbosus TaxID=931172 RepID=A0AAV6TFV5_9ARAC|nr:hypothetical protein JTE90_014854 [Oedothorax gibbosus]